MPKELEVNLANLIERSHDEEGCRTYLEGLRWPDGVTCPRCASKKISRIRTRDQLDCDSCRYRFSVTAGTIFHNTHLPLWKWFAAVYLIVESRKGFSIDQLRRAIGVSYKTAWYLRRRIRAALREVDTHLWMSIVEANAIFVGGEIEKEGGRYRADKTFLGTTANTETADTGERLGYQGIADHDSKHEMVGHQGKERVGDNAHINARDNVSSLLKRCSIDSYPRVHTRHLDAYLDELRFRFNNRENPYTFRDAMWKLLVADNLPYKESTGEREG